MLINTKIVVIIHNKAIKSSFCSGGAANIQTIKQINSNIVPPIAVPTNPEYIKLDRDKSTFKSHRDFCSEKEITFKHL